MAAGNRRTRKVANGVVQSGLTIWRWTGWVTKARRPQSESLLPQGSISYNSLVWVPFQPYVQVFPLTDLQARKGGRYKGLKPFYIESPDKTEADQNKFHFQNFPIHLFPRTTSMNFQVSRNLSTALERHNKDASLLLPIASTVRLRVMQLISIDFYICRTSLSKFPWLLPSALVAITCKKWCHFTHDPPCIIARRLNFSLSINWPFEWDSGAENRTILLAELNGLSLLKY